MFIIMGEGGSTSATEIFLLALESYFYVGSVALLVGLVSLVTTYMKDKREKSKQKSGSTKSLGKGLLIFAGSVMGVMYLVSVWSFLLN